MKMVGSVRVGLLKLNAANMVVTVMPARKLRLRVVDEIDPQLTRPGPFVVPVGAVALEVDLTVAIIIDDPLPSPNRLAVGPVEAAQRPRPLGLAVPVFPVLLALQDELAGRVPDPVGV